MADFALLKTDTLDRAGLPSTDGMAQDSTLGKAVNAAVQWVGSRRPWPWLYDEVTAVTVADTATVALPAAISRLHHVAIGEDALDRRQRQDLFRFGTDPGTPQLYALDGDDALVLAPVPDGVYTVKLGVTLVEPALVAGTDTPLLPVQFHDLLVCRAARYLAVRKRDLEMARLLDDEVKEWMGSLDRAALLAVGSMPIRTRNDWAI